MKTTIATIILMLSALQAHADGFYQLAVGDAPQADVTYDSQNDPIDETPLYQQIMARSRALAAREASIISLAETAAETPLYRTVHGS